MVEDNKLEIILRLAQFVINRSTSEIREELQEYLILISILENNNKATYEEINKYLSQKFESDGFPENIIKGAIERLIANEQVQKINNAYEVNVSVEKKLMGYSLEYDELIDRILNELYDIINSYYRKISDIEKRQIRYSLLLSFGKIFEKFGHDVASIFYQKKLEKMTDIKLEDFYKILYQNLSRSIPEETIKKCIVEYFKRSFENPSEDFSKFLFSLSQAYYLAQVLNLDPEGQKLISSKIQEKKLFLDTNVIINLIFDIEKKKEKIRKKEFDLTRNLGYQIYVTKRTLSEFKVWMDDQKKLEKIIENVILSRFEKTQHILEDGALKEFLYKKQAQPSLTWKGYLAKYTKIEEILLHSYGIAVDATFEIIMKDEKENIQYLIPMVQNHAHKSGNVAEHDAAHIIFIQKIRGKNDILGPNCWFLTNDGSLFSVEKEYHPDATPSTIFGAHWIEMISPFLSPDISKEEGASIFTRIFASSFTSSHLIGESAWLKIQGPWLDTEGLTSEMIEELIGSQYVKEILNKKPEEIDPEELSLSIDKAFIEEFNKREEEKNKLEKEKDKLIEKHSQEIVQLKSHIDEQDNKIKKIEQNQKNQKSILKNNNKIVFLLVIICILASVSIDLILYYVFPNSFNLVFPIIITPQLGIIFVLSGLKIWFGKQIKKLHPNS
ncbi:MAG: hypothetical protein NTV74_05795 [Euryarchaeota archaeon]|nr:hypothetical protein [Euryarchaeota archaeon]